MYNDILLGFLLLSSSFTFSQTLEFHYDESGNQIERKLKTEETARSSGKDAKNAAIDLFASNDAISKDFVIYPNPTRGKVTLEWKAKYTGRIIEIQLADFLGRVEGVSFNGKSNSITLNLSEKKEGVYIMNFYLDDGRRIEKKILRQN